MIAAASRKTHRDTTTLQDVWGPARHVHIREYAHFVAFAAFTSVSSLRKEGGRVRRAE